MTSKIKVKDTDFETLTSKYFDTRNAEAYLELNESVRGWVVYLILLRRTYIFGFRIFRNTVMKLKHVPRYNFILNELISNVQPQMTMFRPRLLRVCQ